MNDITVKNGKTLNSLERTTLRNCEKVITKGVQTFREVGEALAQIRDEQLFRETHGSFKAYCKDRWNFSDSRARQLIGGAERAAEVESVTTVTLSSERHARPLSRLPEEKRGEAWEEAVRSADGGKPTVSQVEQAVARFMPESSAESFDEPDPFLDDGMESVEEQEQASRPSRNGREASAGYGKCPNCAGMKWDEDEEGVSCAKCHHPWGEPVGDEDAKTKKGRKREVWEAQQVMKTWMDAIGRWMNGNPDGIDRYREKFPGPKGDRVIETAKAFFNALDAWKKGLK